MTRNPASRRALACIALGGASLFALGGTAAAQTTPTTQLQLGGAPATTAVGGAAPNRVDAGAGGTATDDSASLTLVALGAVGVAATGAAVLRLRRTSPGAPA